MRISNRLAVDFFYGGRDSYLVRRAECEFGVQRCRIGSQQANRTIVLQYVVLCITLLVLYIYSRNTAVVLYNSSYYTLARVLLWIICILCILRVVLEYESVILLRARMREY